MSLDPLRNPKDPLRDQDARGRELVSAFGQAASGMPREIVVHAAVCLILDAIRQGHATRDSAERAFDELAGKAKAMLLDWHYTSAARRNIFPFPQTIEMPLIDLRGKH